MEKVDETIDCICEWIQGALKGEDVALGMLERVGMVKALAELVSARGKFKEELIRELIRELNDSLKAEGSTDYTF